MKYFLIALSSIVLLSSCATRNAFSALNIGEEQEFALENTRSGKIIFENEIRGIYSLVYLNNIDKQASNDYHQFYISMYFKDDSESQAYITLNKKYPIKILKLGNENKFSKFLPIKNTWTTNFLVTFKNEGQREINLLIDSDQFSSGLLKYVPDQR